MNKRTALVLLVGLAATACAANRRERVGRRDAPPNPPNPGNPPQPPVPVADAIDGVWRDEARNRDIPWRLRWPPGSSACALVIHSHGLGGSREGGDVWGRAWREAGIAVLHIQHRGSDIEVLRDGGMRSLRSAASSQQLRARAEDVRFVVSEVIRQTGLGGAPWSRVRTDAIGLSGHSFGAHTVQAVAGQRFARPAEGLQDDRLRAFIAFSPTLGRGLSPQQQFAGATRPFMLLTGTHDGSPLDDDLTGADRAKVYDALPPGQRALLWVEGADHATFGGGTGAPLSRQAARALQRHQDAERDEALHQQRIARITTDWWRATLLGDASAQASLRVPQGLGPNDRWRMD
jgi:predicted dienelactone hydrolase